MPILALQLGGWAAGVSASVSGRHTVGKGIADLIINGYDESRTDYAVGNTHGSSAALVDAVLAHGRRVGPLSVGVAGHYYKGFGLARSRMFEPTYDVSNLDINVDYVGVNSNDGTGYGVDFGVALQATRVLTLSASLQNAFSKMTWKEELDYRQVTLNKSTIEDVEQILDDFESSERPFDPSSVPLNVYTTAQGLFDEAVFPSVMRVGAMFAPTRRTRFAAAYHQNMTDGRLGSLWDKSASAGVEFSLPIIAVRGGYATSLGAVNDVDAGGDAANMLSAGLSIGPVDIGAAKLSGGNFNGVPRNGWVVTAGLAFRGRAPR